MQNCEAAYEKRLARRNAGRPVEGIKNLFACALVERVPHDQRHLGEGEGKRDRHDAPDLECDPRVRGEGAPDHLVYNSQEQKEEAPAESELPPTFGIQMEGRIKSIAEQRPAEAKPAEQYTAEQRVDDRRLHLDENIVLQPERQRS